VKLGRVSMTLGLVAVAFQVAASGTASAASVATGPTFPCGDTVPDCSAAELQAAADVAASQSASGTSLPSTVSVPLVLQKVGADGKLEGAPVNCSYGGEARAYYDKPSGSVHINETGSASYSTNCPGGAVAAESRIVDQGAGFLSSSQQIDNSNQSSPSIYVPVSQQVALYSFPTNYHAYGSLIGWTDRFHAILPPGYMLLSGSLDSCLGFSALYGGGISIDGYGCN